MAGLTRPKCPSGCLVEAFPGITYYEGLQIKFYACARCNGYWHRVRRTGRPRYVVGREFDYLATSGAPDYDAAVRQIRAGEVDLPDKLVDPKR